MKLPRPLSSLRFPGQLLAVAACVALLWFLMQLKVPDAAPSTPRNPAAASVELVRLDASSADQVLREESALRDPSPLFLPTPLNSAQSVRPESRLREPGDSFLGYTRRLVFPSNKVDLALPEPVAIPEGPADELGRLSWDRPFTGLGQSRAPRLKLEARAAVMEVVAAGQGRIVFSKALEGLALPDNVDWRPCEFLVQTDASGLLGKVPLVQSSGSQIVDLAFSDYLERNWLSAELQAKLPAGIYRIILGP